MRTLLFFLVLLASSAASAQLEHRFTGLARTQAPYLLRNTSLPSRPVSPDSLLRLRQEIVNLPPFADASFRQEISGEDTLLHWEIKESRTRFPLVDFGGLRGNLNYLIGFKDIHFRGRGEELSAYYQNNDGEHNFRLGYRNPNLGGSRWGYGLELRRYASREPLYFGSGAVNYRYENLSATASLEYALRPRHRLSLGVSRFRENYERLDATEDPAAPPGLTQQKILFKAGHDLDRRDFHQERLAGFRHTTTAQSVLTREETGHFLILLHETTYFRLLGPRGNFAARLRAGLSSNEEGPFAPFTLDSQLNLRGSGNRIDRGTAQFVVNLEYRHRLWQDRRGRFAVQGVVFSDFGTWRSPGGNLNELLDREDFNHFVGGGLRVVSLQNKGISFRVDYGVDVSNEARRGVVLGVGQYF